MNRIPPPIDRMPEVSDPIEDKSVVVYLNRLRKSMSDALAKRATKTEPVMEVLLYSPSGKVFSVKVDNAGALSTEEKAS
jgi:hypothetical protein